MSVLGMVEEGDIHCRNHRRRQIESTARDSSVKATLLDIDSPGGLVSGMAETAASIERSGMLKTGKPVFAVIRSYGASAGARSPPL